MTDIGKKELQENAYVPYMHKHPHRTTEVSSFGKEFNVWTINKLLGNGDKSNWEEVVDHEDQELLADQEKRKKVDDERRLEYIESYKEKDPETYKEMSILNDELKAQDEQIAVVNKAENKYKEDKDLDAYIKFWENIWSNGGLLFRGIKWIFRLTELYIKAKRYDDALEHLKMIKEKVPDYDYKANQYIEKIEKLKVKSKKSK